MIIKSDWESFKMRGIKRLFIEKLLFIKRMKSGGSSRIKTDKQ